MTTVNLQNSPQSTGSERIALTSGQDFSGSRSAWILDSLFKLFRKIVSPQNNYGAAAIMGEAQMDFNSKGGLVVGVYGIAEGTGKTGSGVNDIVGVHGTAHKNAQGWAAGVHADVYDYVGGGTAIGVNVEFPLTQPTTTTIGVNVQPNVNGKVIGMNLQGNISTMLNAEGKADCLLTMNSGSPMWKGSGDTGGNLGQHVGKIRITIDGQAFYLPVYK